MKIICYFLIAFILIFAVSVVAESRELCDCYDHCTTIYQRDVNTKMKRFIKLRDGFSPYARMEIDHKLPLCLGGTNNASNLWALTKEQHKKKTEHDLLMLYYVENCYMTLEEARQEELNFRF